MKKIERLRLVEERFGARFVLPYRVCRTWPEIEAAAKYFESQQITWGLRTDTHTGLTAAMLSPFVLQGTAAAAREIWNQHGDTLVYIVSQNILHYLLNGVARPIDEAAIFFEINDYDQTLAQRRMYDSGQSHLKQFAVGPGRRELYDIHLWVPSFHPEDDFVTDRRLNEIYQVMAGDRSIDEVTFSVRLPDKRVIIW